MTQNITEIDGKSFCLDYFKNLIKLELNWKHHDPFKIDLLEFCHLKALSVIQQNNVLCN